MQQLVLIGAGHAHLGVIKRLATQPLSEVAVTLVTPQPKQIYSGMLPGWMAGWYDATQIAVDVATLCQQARVRLVPANLKRVDAQHRQVHLNDQQRLAYDVLSLNTGGQSDMRWLTHAADVGKSTIASAAIAPTQADDMAVLAIRPLAPVMQAWPQWLQAARARAHFGLAVVGGGAAAAEVVMAAQVALQRISPAHQACLVSGEHWLKDFTPALRRQVAQQLRRLGIARYPARAVAVQGRQVQLSDGRTPIADALLAVTGSIAPSWTQVSDLATDTDGFVAVNAQQQSVSHPNVFAVGDVARRVDRTLAHSGVHAVHGGAVLADNLWAWFTHQRLRPYQPRKRTLYLLACGDRYAIGSWGNYHGQGRWVWYLKRGIDRRFVHQYQQQG